MYGRVEDEVTKLGSWGKSREAEASGNYKKGRSSWDLYTSISYLNLRPSTHSNGMNLYSSILPFHAGLQIIL